jgi:DNA polymerase-3 subunit delta
LHGFRQIERDLKNNDLRDVRTILLHGSEALLTGTYEKRLMQRFVEPAAVSLDFLRFDAEEAETDDIIAACDTLPMVSEKRVVVAAGFPGDEKFHTSPKGAALARYLPSAPASTLLIFTAASFPKRPALYKAIVAHGRAYEFSRLGREDLHAFVKGRFKMANVAVSDEIADAVVNASGYFDRESAVDLFSVESDVRRVAAHASLNEGRTAGLADVVACMDAADDTHVFALLDAVSSGRKGDALELLENISSKGDAAYRLLALLTGQFEIMLGYKEMKERSRPFSEISKALGVKSDFRLKRVAGFADNYSVSALMKLLDRLYRVDRDIKTGLYGDRLALTMFVAEM